MKRLSDALGDFVSSNRKDTTVRANTSHRSPPRHYNHIRKQRARASSNIPSYAVHYPATPNGSLSEPATHAPNFIGLLADPDNALPVTFLPTTAILVVDTGASVTITPDKADFIQAPRPVQPTTLQGIASGLSVQGIGTVSYTFHTDKGTPVTVLLPNVLYVPDCSIHLLCPRHLAEATGVPGDGFLAFSKTATLRCHGTDITVAYNARTGLPIVVSTLFAPGPSEVMCPNVPVCAVAISSSPESASAASMWNHPNLTKAQQLKLLMHEHCNHRSMSIINDWIRQGLLPVDPQIASCPDPICAACQFGKSR
jgi:hypothetical protein